MSVASKVHIDYQALTLVAPSYWQPMRVYRTANDYPKVEDAVCGMAFIEATVASSKKNAAWTRLDV